MIGIKLGLIYGGAPTLLQQALSAIRRNNGTALYVPDDYRGAFVDSTGTQPVTAVNDLVGLLTDRSYGAGNLGVELAPLTTAWGLGTGVTQNTTTGTITFTATPVNQFAMRGNVLEAGKSYLVEFTVASISGGSINMLVSGGAGTAQASVPGTYRAVVKAVNKNGPYLWVNTATTTALITSATCREVLGNHATQGTTASKPLVTQLANGTKALDFDGSNDLLTLSSGAILQQGSDHFVTAAFVLDAVGTVQAFYGASSTASNTPLVALLSVNTSPATLTCLWRDDAGIQVQPASTVALVAGVPYVATASKVGNTYSLWLNGVLVASTTASLGTTTLNTANIGMLVRLGQSHQLNGKLIDIVIDQGTLTAADRKTIERNMAQRAGMAYVG